MALPAANRYTLRDVVCLDHLLHPFSCKKEGLQPIDTTDRRIYVIATTLLIAVGISLIGLSSSPLLMVGIFVVACPLIFYIHAATTKSRRIAEQLNGAQGTGGDIA